VKFSTKGLESRPKGLVLGIVSIKKPQRGAYINHYVPWYANAVHVIKNVQFSSGAYINGFSKLGIWYNIQVLLG
jgi:hypothetical protein